MNDRPDTPGLLSHVFWLTLALVITGWTGCKSRSPSQYVSPRVTGRVVDAQSLQPISNVQVRRIEGSSDRSAKGAQRLEQSASVRTREDGTFTLESERDLAFLRQVYWFSITLSFGHPDYVSLQKTFNSNIAKNTPSGEPLIEAGDISMEPRRVTR